MKLTNFFKSIALGSILVFSFGCGKDNKSGPGYGSFMSLYQDGTSDPSSRQVLEQLNNWYNSNRENVSPYFPDGLYTIYKVKVSQTAINNGGGLPAGCREETILKIFKVVICSGNSNPINTETGENIISTRTTEVRSNNGIVINQKNNEALRAVLSGANGRLVSARYNGQYELVFLSSDNKKVTTHIINTNYNSAFNPTAQIIQNLETGVLEQIGTRVLLQVRY